MASTDPKAPGNASELYKSLLATAAEFIHCMDRDDSQPTRMNMDRIRAIRTPDFQHSFGHNNFISTKPQFKGTLRVDDFLAHVNSMTPKLDTWDTHITDIVVDESRKMCIGRASYYMKPFGADEPVENDIVWWLWMEDGAKKVKKAMEFIDATATGRIGELIMEGNK